MNENETLLRFFYALVWGQGGLLALVGLVYLLSTSFDLGPITPKDRKRIARYLGLMMVFVGSELLIGGWAKGVSEYVKAYDSPWLGWVMIVTAGLGSIMVVLMLATSIIRWVRAKAK